MVCIAAFVIFLLIWLFTPLLRLFGKRKLANSISKTFKKSLHCFSRRVTFRPCDTDFKTEIKDSLLSKLIVRHKKLVKPASFLIEALAALIILLTVWSGATVVKSGLAYYVYGTCNVKKPESCALSTSQACSIDSFKKTSPVVDWFSEWGEIFDALPARMKTWNASEYIPKNGKPFTPKFGFSKTDPVAVDIFDPGCIVCRNSFVAQLNSDFFSKYNTYIIPYVIAGKDGDKFKNSRVVASYIEAARGLQPSSGGQSGEWIIVRELFTGISKGKVYQDLFNESYTNAQAATTIEEWLKTSGFSEEAIGEIRERANSSTVKETLKKTDKLVKDKIKTKRIPTMIYDGKRHDGLFKKG